MLSRLADRLIMFPTRHPIDTERRSRVVIESNIGPFEAFQQRSGASDEPAMLILKFVGTGGPGGGKFGTGRELAEAVANYWPDGAGVPYVVCTGGEPLLQLDAAAEAFACALRINPQYGKAHHSLGLIQLWKGE